MHSSQQFHFHYTKYFFLVLAVVYCSTDILKIALLKVLTRVSRILNLFFLAVQKVV